MTPEQRQKAFIEAYNAIVNQYGYTFQVRTVPADTPVAVTPPVVLAEVPGWTNPPLEEVQSASVLDNEAK